MPTRDPNALFRAVHREPPRVAVPPAYYRDAMPAALVKRAIVMNIGTAQLVRAGVLDDWHHRLMTRATFAAYCEARVYDGPEAIT